MEYGHIKRDCEKIVDCIVNNFDELCEKVDNYNKPIRSVIGFCCEFLNIRFNNYVAKLVTDRLGKKYLSDKRHLLHCRRYKKLDDHMVNLCQSKPDNIFIIDEVLNTKEFKRMWPHFREFIIRYPEYKGLFKFHTMTNLVTVYRDKDSTEESRNLIKRVSNSKLIKFDKIVKCIEEHKDEYPSVRDLVNYTKYSGSFIRIGLKHYDKLRALHPFVRYRENMKRNGEEDSLTRVHKILRDMENGKSDEYICETYGFKSIKSLREFMSNYAKINQYKYNI